MDRRVGGLQSQSERGGEVKNSRPLPVLESPIIQPVAQLYTTELSGCRRGNFFLLLGIELWSPNPQEGTLLSYLGSHVSVGQ